MRCGPTSRGRTCSQARRATTTSAAGEFLRRLTARCVVRVTRGLLRRTLGDTHIGDALSGGVEIGSQLARSFIHRNAGDRRKALLLVDYENAHNTPERGPGLRVVRERCPSLSPFLETCYSVPSPMYCGSDTIWSTRGYHQGCASAGPGWSVGFLPVQETAQKDVAAAGHVLDYQAWFKDDGQAGGSPSALRVWYAALHHHRAGLHSEAAKVARPHAPAVPAQYRPPPVGDHARRRDDAICPRVRVRERAREHGSARRRRAEGRS